MSSVSPSGPANRREGSADAACAAQPSARTILPFIALLCILSIPFWILGASGAQLLPGLPTSALMAVCPGLAAAILLWPARGRIGLAELLSRSFDYTRVQPKLWYLPILFFPPCVQAAAFALTALSGVHLPAPHIVILPALAMSIAFFMGALCEELGWTGYVLAPLTSRLGVLRAAVLLGVLWAAWHIIPLVEAHRTFAWIAWWSLATVSLRVIMVWLYDHAGPSVFAMALFHAMNNFAWQISPNLVVYYDPAINGALLAAAALILVACVFLSRSRGRWRATRAGAGHLPH